ncbi:beta-glucosidase family protein [Streptomyces bambusae]|uniref:Beta-glucosidase n=1 Tax=Streptomyces bambusae TaxID=1550616 RepID=A0ABS6ZEF7_9ACTN|nr:glycoside hydrolase family 3 C-terminal domain-containing protein [Streptomyces bambusae]MBW5486145.1 beta-glucosidase [Streptomyces bambusae]
MNAPAPAPAHTPAHATATVTALVAAMTLDEKISFVHGADDPEQLGQSGYIPGVPRLGIPALRMTDGPAGVRMKRRTTTALPAPVVLSCAFDDELAARYGEFLGFEARAKRQDVLIGPMLNVLRQPYGGRNFELYGEDPLLVTAIGTAVVQGIQSQGVIAMPKHFAANNQEENRMAVDTVVDERTLREIEFPAFQSVVRAGAGALMGATNSVNGQFSCENETLLTTVLRDEWGFEGWVMSDWDAVHDTAAVERGLDQEMPNGAHLGEPLRLAIEEGRVDESVLDRAVARIVGQMARFGLIAAGPDTPPEAAAALTPADRPVPERDAVRGRALAREIALAGSVLLHNPDGVLPLSAERLAEKGVAVIGRSADVLKTAGVGSALVVPESARTPLEVLRERLGDEAVTFAIGEDPAGRTIPESALVPPFRTGEVAPGPSTEPDYFYEGVLTIETPGRYRIAVTALGGYAAIDLEGHPRVFAGSSFGDTAGLTADLEPGSYKLVLSALPVPDQPVRLTLGWVTPEQARADIDEAVAAARAADVALVFAYDELAELIDRPALPLPGLQDTLITEVAKANPRTVVVLNTGSSVPMPWLEHVAGVLDVWYPGEAGAEAADALLFGDANPAGKLTQSFPVDAARTSVAGDPLRYPGVDGRVEYREGVFVGYRWHDEHGVPPLFPFGHGLSYTTFAYEDLDLTPAGTDVTVSCTVRNTGDRAGREIVQVYLGRSHELDVPQPPKTLAGWTTVDLEPGASARVSVTVDAERFTYWDDATRSRRVAAGAREVLVGRSSADLPLTGKVHVAADGTAGL